VSPERPATTPLHWVRRGAELVGLLLLGILFLAEVGVVDLGLMSFVLAPAPAMGAIVYGLAFALWAPTLVGRIARDAGKISAEACWGVVRWTFRVFEGCLIILAAGMLGLIFWAQHLVGGRVGRIIFGGLMIALWLFNYVGRTRRALGWAPPPTPDDEYRDEDEDNGEDDDAPGGPADDSRARHSAAEPWMPPR